ncbi:MAG: sigma-70 family RNA polymerase sigma factor [Planctomycetes bacterium]|nr:sigma-70 family RNA polymerase sigma factor [Planctomycetota bacterium]
MGMLDTSLGGLGKEFPATTWGLLSQLRDQTPAARHPAYQELCRRYWKPVYCHLRVCWSKSNEDAKDLTQAFFLWLFKDGALSRYDRQRGSLRRYLKVLLRRFVGHAERALVRLKRGGDVCILSLEDLSSADSLDVGRVGPSEEVFDREWTLAVVAEAVKRVRERLTKEGRGGLMLVYEAYDLCEDARQPTYAELARRFDLTEGQVRHQLHEVRGAVREEILGELRQMTSSEQDLREEWNALFGA